MAQPTSLNLDQLKAIINELVAENIENKSANKFSFLNVPDQKIDSQYIGQTEDLEKIPDIVRSIREFAGNQDEFNSWRKSVTRVLQIYEHLKGTPKYFAILSYIRHKIIGNADTALESYNTPLDWNAISRCLAMHYSDKRDIRTLENQMTMQRQGSKSIQEFYQSVYSYLTTILNKLSSIESTPQALALLTQTYREKALDTFIRGLNGDLPRLLGMKEPEDLPQALHLCLKLENQNYRSNITTKYNNYPPALPPRPKFRNNTFYPQIAHMPNSNPGIYQRNFNQQRHRPPQSRPEPMDVDRSIQTRQVNYANRPSRHLQNYKRQTTGSMQVNTPNKIQRNFNIESNNDKKVEEYLKKIPDLEKPQYSDLDYITESEIDYTDFHFLD